MILCLLVSDFWSTYGNRDVSSLALCNWSYGWPVLLYFTSSALMFRGNPEKLLLEIT